MDNSAALPQPAPASGLEEVFNLVMKDLADRREMGVAKYGQPLMTFDGRDTLMDAYQEALDLAMYLRKEIAERDAMVTQAQLGESAHG